MRKSVIASIAIMVSAGSAAFIAPSIAVGQSAVPAATPDGWLSTSEVAAGLSAEGWTILWIEADSGRYEACLVGANGQVEATIDPVSGQIVTQRSDDSCDLGRSAVAGQASSALDDDDDEYDDDEDDDFSSHDEDDGEDDDHGRDGGDDD